LYCRLLCQFSFDELHCFELDPTSPRLQLHVVVVYALLPI